MAGHRPGRRSSLVLPRSPFVCALLAVASLAVFDKVASSALGITRDSELVGLSAPEHSYADACFAVPAGAPPCAAGALECDGGETRVVVGEGGHAYTCGHGVDGRRYIGKAEPSGDAVWRIEEPNVFPSRTACASCLPTYPTMISLAAYHRDHVRLNLTEGGLDGYPGQAELLQRLVRDHGVRKVLEVGFNAGFSSELLLRSRPDVQVLSFDWHLHAYVRPAKLYLDHVCPNRHVLVSGHSAFTMPAYLHHNPANAGSYDLIIIDGGHTLEVALADWNNARPYAHAGTVVVIDDVLVAEAEGKLQVTRFPEARGDSWGPTAMWLRVMDAGQMQLLGHHRHDVGRGCVWGLMKPAEV